MKKELFQELVLRFENVFSDFSKTIAMPEGAVKQMDDIALANSCYSIAQNGDPSKPGIAVAQNYFAAQTGRAEVIEQLLLEFARENSAIIRK